LPNYFNENVDQFVGFVTDNTDLFSELNNYIKHASYNTNLCDFLLTLIQQMLEIELVVLVSTENGYLFNENLLFNTRKDSNGKTMKRIYIEKKRDHYDSLIPIHTIPVEVRGVQNQADESTPKPIRRSQRCRKSNLKYSADDSAKPSGERNRGNQEDRCDEVSDGNEELLEKDLLEVLQEIDDHESEELETTVVNASDMHENSLDKTEEVEEVEVEED
jgi:hypothetical protein